jgi:hypothetical protein
MDRPTEPGPCGARRKSNPQQGHLVVSPGAKIDVVGAKGAGKSAALRFAVPLCASRVLEMAAHHCVWCAASDLVQTECCDSSATRAVLVVRQDD